MPDEAIARALADGGVVIDLSPLELRRLDAAAKTFLATQKGIIRSQVNDSWRLLRAASLLAPSSIARPSIPILV